MPNSPPEPLVPLPTVKGGTATAARSRARSDVQGTTVADIRRARAEDQTAAHATSTSIGSSDGQCPTARRSTRTGHHTQGTTRVDRTRPDNSPSSPPEPLVPLPTVTRMEPPRPLVEAPEPKYSAPLLPPLAVPELKTRRPLTPARPALAVRTVSAPLVVARQLPS